MLDSLPFFPSMISLSEGLLLTLSEGLPFPPFTENFFANHDFFPDDPTAVGEGARGGRSK